MCRFFGVSRSGYYDFVRRGDRPEKDKELADIIAMQRKRCWGTYGYRRMCLWLRGQNIYKNPKTVLRIMKKYDLLSEIRRRRKWVRMGQQAHRYENLLNRQFQADKANTKWVTDISYIHTKQGVLYLSNWGQFNHGFGAFPVLFTGLENKPDGAIEVPIVGQLDGGAQEDCHVAVVAAGVGFARDGRGIGKPETSSNYV